MAKKSFGNGLNSILGSSVIDQEIEEAPAITQEEKKPQGRPRTNMREITNTSQKGTKEGETRSTFIVNEKMLNRLKALSYWKRKQIKVLMHEALKVYFDTHSSEEIRRAEEEYNQSNDGRSFKNPDW